MDGLPTKEGVEVGKMGDRFQVTVSLFTHE